MSDSPKFSVLIGCFGDYPEYSLRAVKSALDGRVLGTKKQKGFDLHVGANSCSPRTLKQLRKLYDSGHIDSLIEVNKNINKCPMKRLLIERTETKFALWLDDDSHLLLGWDQELTSFLENNPHLDVAGCFYQMPRTRKYKMFLTKRPWYRGEEFWSPDTKDEAIFATGGCYVFSIPFVRKFNYPDKAIVKRADDLLLGDLVAQQGRVLLSFSPELLDKVRISDGIRRGTGEEVSDFLAVDPVTGEHYESLEEETSTLDPYDTSVIYEMEDSIPLATQAHMLFQDGKVQEALSLYLKAAEMNPTVSEVLYNIAIAYEALGNFGMAIKYFDKAIYFKKDYAEAYNNKGKVCFRLKRYEEAVDLFKRAVTFDRKLFSAHNNLGNCYLVQENYQSAVRHFQIALKIQPQNAELHLNLSIAFYRIGNINSALLHARLATFYAPNYAEAHFHLAFLWLKTENYQQGWKELEWRFQCRLWRPIYNYKRSRPEDITKEKPLIVVQEGSDVDAMYFLKDISLLLEKGIEVTFVCTKGLGALAQLIPGLKVMSDLERNKPDLEAVPLFSLPLYRTFPNSVSKLSVLAERHLQSISPHLITDRPDKIKVGLSWKSKSKQNAIFKSNLELSSFDKLFHLPNISIYPIVDSLVSDEKVFLARFEKTCLLESSFDNYLQIAKWVSQLDLIITTDNEVAVISGLLGKDCRVILQQPSSWAWHSKSTSSWFPSLRILPFIADPSSVVSLLAQELLGLKGDVKPIQSELSI